MNSVVFFSILYIGFGEKWVMLGIGAVLSQVICITCFFTWKFHFFRLNSFFYSNGVLNAF